MSNRTRYRMQDKKDSRFKIQDSSLKTCNLQLAACNTPHHAGFTLVELLVTMTVFVLVIAAASQIFTGLLTQFKQQSKIAETNIEAIVGLDILRRDLEHTGLGLPWNIPTGTTYSEASSTTICGTANPSTYNDSSTNPPRAVVSGNNNCTNNSDYLVIKAVNVATNDPSSKWTELVYATSCSAPYSSFATNVCKRAWSPSTEDLSNGDYVIVISPGTTSTTEMLLNANSGAFTATSLSSINSSWLPTSVSDNVRIVYGLRSSGNAPQRPFNRADYYISTTNVPQRCATNTGVLLKATMDYNGGFTQYPLLDCVADMQVVYRLDMDEDGVIGTRANANGSSVSDDPDYNDPEGASVGTVQGTLTDASLLRRRLKEVRVYILAHEGQRDVNYTFNNFSCADFDGKCITVGEFGMGRNFDLRTITNYLDYRWKVYPIVVKPNNLSGE